MIYGVTVGSGKFANMALCQLRSLQEYTSATQNTIIANCPPDEWDDIPDPIQREIRSLAQVTHQPPPIPGYKLSTFYATGIQCIDTADSDEWVVLLDTDTLVLGSLTDAVSTDDTLAVKPADLHFEYGNLTETILRDCYRHVDVPFPDTTTTTTVDNETIPPYWNGGVVYFNDPVFLSDWIETTKSLHEKYPDEFFLDQLSLSVVSTRYDTTVLTEKYNFPLPHRYWVPLSTRVLHYHNPIELPWVLNPNIYSKLRHIGAFDILDRGRPLNQVKRLGIRLGRSRFRL